MGWWDSRIPGDFGAPYDLVAVKKKGQLLHLEGLTMDVISTVRPAP